MWTQFISEPKILKVQFLFPPPEEHGKFYVTGVMMILLHLKGLFGVEANEDPNSLLKGFMKVCDPFKFAYISQESFRLHLFQLSLMGKVVLGIRSLPTRSITSLTSLMEVFLGQYFQPSRKLKLRDEMVHFRQYHKES